MCEKEKVFSLIISLALQRIKVARNRLVGRISMETGSEIKSIR